MNKKIIIIIVAIVIIITGIILFATKKTKTQDVSLDQKFQEFAKNNSSANQAASEETQKTLNILNEAAKSQGGE